MLGLMIASTTQQAPTMSAWTSWVDYIVKNKDMFVKSATLVYTNGQTAANTRGFKVTAQELKAVERCFASDHKPESITVNGKTYIIKNITPGVIIAFNGSKYVLISKSHQMYVVGLCTSRMRSEEASNFIQRVAGKLKEKDY